MPKSVPTCTAFNHFITCTAFFPRYLFNIFACNRFRSFLPVSTCTYLQSTYLVYETILIKTRKINKTQLGPAGVAAPKYPERAEKPTGTWEKEDKDGKEIEHTRGAKLVSGDARIANMTNKICG